MGSLRTSHRDIGYLSRVIEDLNGDVGDIPWGHWGHPMGSLWSSYGDIEDLNGAIGDLNGDIGNIPWGH